jgi:4'-phosphopantetheinyl transferase
MEEMDLVAKRIFSPDESDKFQKISERERLRAFYNCWTRKEAFIKAIGEGLSFPLQKLEISFEPDLPARLLSVADSVEQTNKWSMHDIKSWDGYAAALVVEGNDYSISHKQWKDINLDSGD